MPLNEINLKDPVRYIKGVGERKAFYLRELGIKTVEDLIFYFPRTLQDRRNLNNLNTKIVIGEKITVVGNILYINKFKLKNGLGILRCFIKTNLQQYPIVCLIWFKRLNYKYNVFEKLEKHLKDENKKKIIIAFGELQKKITRIPQIIVKEFEVVENLSEQTIHTNRLTPIYPCSENISQQWLRELIYNVLSTIKIEENLPETVIHKENFVSKDFAIKNIHFPQNWQSYYLSRKRIAFDNFLSIQLKVLQLKKIVKCKPKVGNYKLQKTLLTPFKNNLKLKMENFDFTRAQKKVINELFKDMLSQHAMNRLLIGDVGSGKTLVAVSCALLAIENNYQVAFMAPTEILAVQHYYNIKTYVENLINPHTGKYISVKLLVGKSTKKEKEMLLQELKQGDIDIVIGTHALLEKDVVFENLSLVIIDEQHRFGVIQRKKLYDKSELADVLIMTATPIPRSLAMTLYGELDISIMDELPPGRIPIKTFYIEREQDAYNFVLERLKFNEKVYFVYPVIEESKSELKSLMLEYKKLSSTVFSNYPCSILHGKMSAKEKEEVMLKFKNGDYKILFSTTVIEVGIDVKDATVIVINHAERFGLSTLHQLRGRVGRSQKQSYCLLLGELKTSEARQRIDTMVQTNDGFEIAQKDLELRGPGEIFSTVQHGETQINYEDLIRYSEELIKAKQWAKKIVFSKNIPQDLLDFVKQNSFDSSALQLGNIG